MQGVSPCGMLDVTNPNASKWLVQKLRGTLDELEADRLNSSSKVSPVSFYVNTGDFTSIPHFFNFSRPLDNPDVVRNRLVDVVMKHFSVVGVSGISNKLVLHFIKSWLGKIS